MRQLPVLMRAVTDHQQIVRVSARKRALPDGCFQGCGRPAGRHREEVARNIAPPRSHQAGERGAGQGPPYHDYRQGLLLGSASADTAGYLSLLGLSNVNLRRSSKQRRPCNTRTTPQLQRLLRSLFVVGVKRELTTAPHHLGFQQRESPLRRSGGRGALLANAAAITKSARPRGEKARELSADTSLTIDPPPVADIRPTDFLEKRIRQLSAHRACRAVSTPAHYSTAA